MKIIKISCEFGSGGREIGKRIADILEFAITTVKLLLLLLKTAALSFLQPTGRKGAAIIKKKMSQTIVYVRETYKIFRHYSCFHYIRMNK